MMHPACELRWLDDEIGYGVFAKEPIARGTITYARDPFDQAISADEIARLPEVLRAPIEHYAFVLADGTRILCWDSGRFVNHSCEPTCRGLGPDYEVAVRDIAANEQVTSDYAELNIMTSFVCRCGSRACRGGVGPGDLARFGAAWDALVASVVPLLSEVPQPLWPLVREPELLLEAAAGRRPLQPRSSYFFSKLRELSA